MLTTARGTLTTSRGMASPALNPVAGTARTYHFTGSQSQSQGGGRWRFTLEPAPRSIDRVDFDGALLYEGLNPGFSWDGGGLLDLELPDGTFCAEVRVHVRGSI